MAVLPAPSGPTHELGGARFTSLATPSRGSSDTSVWLVEIAPGTPGTPHRLTREEVFVVLSGRAEVRLDGEVSVAGAGDAIVVPAGVPFALAAAGGAPLRALCCLPVGGPGQRAGAARRRRGDLGRAGTRLGRAARAGPAGRPARRPRHRAARRARGNAARGAHRQLGSAFAGRAPPPRDASSVCRSPSAGPAPRVGPVGD